MNSALEQDDAEQYPTEHAVPERTTTSTAVVEREPDADPDALDALVGKVFGTSDACTIQRLPDGLRTQLYRVRRGEELFCLRLAEVPDENLETDAELHEQLSRLGVDVPRVVFVEPFDEQLGRSALITTLVRGVPLEQVSSRTAATAVLRAAGADLARLNRLPVEGFGWVRRYGRGRPRAALSSYSDLVTDLLPAPWPGPLADLFAPPVLGRIEAMVEHERHRDVPSAHLAHGDFRPTHIFTQRGSYTGLMDLAELRGADRFFDLGYFHLHVEETGDTPLLSAVLGGYQEVATLPPDHRETIRRSAIVHGLGELCAWLTPGRRAGRSHPVPAARISRLDDLVRES